MNVRIGRAIGLAVVAAALHGTLAAQRPASGTLLVLSKQERRLSLVDGASLRVIGTVPAGDNPAEIAVSADGTLAYISNTGAGPQNTITIVDLVARKLLGTIDTGALTRPRGLAVANGHLWFTAEGARAVARFDPATHKVDLILGTGQNGTQAIAVGPRERQVFATSVASGTVTAFTRALRAVPPRSVSEAISGGTVQQPHIAAPHAPPPSAPQPSLEDWAEVTIPVGKGSEGLDLSPDGKEVWVANALTGIISILDRTSDAIVASLASGLEGADRLKFTPDGAHVLISGAGRPDLVVVDAATRQISNRITVGQGAAGIAIQHDGRRAFVACTADHDVAVIDLTTMSVTARIAVGSAPDGLALVP